MENLEFKGTKGEWDLTKFRNVYGDGKMICATQSNFTEEEEIANAKLIAAAPDLLQIVLRLKKEYEEIPEDTLSDGALKFKKEIEKAIEKALK